MVKNSSLELKEIKEIRSNKIGKENEKAEPTQLFTNLA